MSIRSGPSHAVIDHISTYFKRPNIPDIQHSSTGGLNSNAMVEVEKFNPNKTFLKVYTLFLTDPDTEIAGCDVCKITGLRSGVVYPLLHALEGKNWIIGKWEIIPEDTRRTKPQRKFYKPTAVGVKEGMKIISEEYPNLRSAFSTVES